MKIFIVDADEGWRHNLREHLEGDGHEVCGQASGVSDLLFPASGLAADVVAIELGAFLSRQSSTFPERTAFLVFVESAGETALERILSEGPPGVVSKQEPPETWLQATDIVGSGARFLSPGVLEAVLGPYLAGRAPRSDAESPPTLTKRECEVVSLLAEGGRNRELAMALGISVKTVEHHRASAMRKLGVRGVPGLVREAIRLGLVQSS